jgi:hypothetical protein
VQLPPLFGLQIGLPASAYDSDRLAVCHGSLRRSRAALFVCGTTVSYVGQENILSSKPRTPAFPIVRIRAFLLSLS